MALGAVLFVFFGIRAWRTSRADCQHFDMVDLRERIVGTRAMSSGLTPYLVHGPDPYLQDPCAIGPIGAASRATNPPTAYLFTAPIAGLSYQAAKQAWNVIQWLALLLAVSALIAWDVSEIGIVLIGVSIGLLATPPLRLHLERGQMYTIVLALLAVGSLCHVRYHKPITGGAFYGIVMAAKIVPGVLIVPLVIARQWRALFGVVLGLAGMVLLSTALWGIAPWRDFFQHFVPGFHRFVPGSTTTATWPAADNCSMFMPPGLTNATWSVFASKFRVHLGLVLAVSLASLLMWRQLRASELGVWWWLWMSIFMQIIGPAMPVYWRYQEVLWILVLPVTIALYRARRLHPFAIIALASAFLAVCLQIRDNVAVGLMLVFLFILAWTASSQEPLMTRSWSGGRTAL
ncbi:MAG TPA: glycosyltransferase family 87 protein [Polyangia bacterium]